MTHCSGAVSSHLREKDYYCALGLRTLLYYKIVPERENLTLRIVHPEFLDEIYFCFGDGNKGYIGMRSYGETTLDSRQERYISYS